MKRIRIHPGEVLREEFLKPLSLSANALSIALSVNAPRVNDIVLERRSVSPEMAVRLAQYFGTTPEFWLNLQMAYDLSHVAQDKMLKIESEITPNQEAKGRHGDRIEIKKDLKDNRWHWFLEQSHNPHKPVARSEYGYATAKIARERLNVALRILDSRSDLPIHVIKS